MSHEGGLFESSGDLDARIEELQQFQDRLLQLSGQIGEGASDDGAVRVVTSLSGPTAVEIDPALVQRRTDGSGLSGKVREALAAANQAVAQRLQTDLGALGVQLPPAAVGGGQEAAAAGSEASKASEEAIQRLRTDYPEFADLVDRAIAEQRAAAEQITEVVSSDALVTATFSGLGELIDLSFDTMGLREADNLTINDAVLEVLQRAPTGTTSAFDSSMAQVQADVVKGMQESQTTIDDALRPLRGMNPSP